MKEKWRPIEGFEDKYEISSSGSIMSLNYMRTGIAKKLSICLDSDGYSVSSLYKNGHATNVKIHRLVAAAFLHNPRKLPHVNHKNGIRTDNRLCNLEWSSVADNLNHAYKVLGRKGASTGKLGKENYGGQSVYQVCMESGKIMGEYGSLSEASRLTGVNINSMSAALRGYRNYTHAGGFKWKYVHPGGEINGVANKRKPLYA